MKPLSLLLVLTALFKLNPIHSQDTALVKPSELQYTSDFEKKHFQDFLASGKPDLLALAISLNENSTEFEYQKVRKGIDQIYLESDKKIKGESDVSKKVKYLFEKIHKNMFRKYDLQAHFEKIFTDGTYNCVTGSMLYGFVFEHYGIPFKIMEKPKHVYLIADPADKKILVESTDPGSGYFLPNEKYKKQYVDYLVKNKLVSKSELDEQGYDQLFEKSFYADEKINFQQLVGLQYYNSAVEYFNAKDFKNTLSQIQKAYVLYPCERIKFILESCYPILLQDKDFSDLRDVDLYVKYFNLSKEEDKSYFIAEFSAMTEKFLMNENKKEHYDRIFEKISAGIKDSLFMNKIFLYYYGEYARLEYMNGNYKQALDHMIVAYARNPENAKAKALFASLVSDQMRTSNDYKKIISNLDEYVVKYPFLKDNINIRQAYGNLYLIMAGSYFEANNEKQALIHLKNFETLAQNKELIFNEAIIGLSYSAGWGYYVRMQKRQYAKQFINKGLEYAPFSTELQHKKRIANEDTSQ
ncbi:MAG TPA: hypothetical protein VF868_11195 [Bacteroidia bacterium]|jgi:hypothetical protein